MIPLYSNIVSRFGNLSALKDFISFLATVKGDLSNITAPPFILAPQSLTEFPAYWAERPTLFTKPAFQEDPGERILSVLLNYLNSLHRQYYVGQPIEAGTKKPLNPFLGELFLCSYSSDVSDIKVISEQVSHHPPTTACYLSDEKTGMHAEGYSTQHTSLSGTSIVVRQSGHAICTVDKYNESYLLPFPDVYAKNVLTGSPYPDLSGQYKIVSTSGYIAEINFGYTSKSKSKKIMSLGGGKNEFYASVYKSGQQDRPLYELSGCWSDSWVVKDGSGKELYEYDIFDPKNMAAKQEVRPIEEQSPWESRRAWQTVAEGLREGDFKKALHAKSELEDGQREMRKKEKAEGKQWESIFFEKVNESEEAISKASALGRLMKVREGQHVRDELGSHGMWRFSPEKERRYREGQISLPKGPTEV